MVVISLGCFAFMSICITVYAAVRTGVVCADVRAFGAAALVSCRLFFVWKTIRKEQILDNTAVDTVGLLYFVAD